MPWRESPKDKASSSFDADFADLDIQTTDLVTNIDQSRESSLDPSPYEPSFNEEHIVDQEIPNSEGDHPTSHPQTSDLQSTHIQSYQLARDRERRIIQPPARYNEADFATFALTYFEENLSPELNTFNQAMNSENKEKWLEAMNAELSSLNENSTWVLVNKPENQNF